MRQLIVIMAGFCSVCLTVGLGWYAISNDSGHTGLDPLREVLFFQLLALFASATGLALAGRSGKYLPYAITSLLASIGGVGFPFFLDKTKVLREYSVWAHSGLEAPPEHKNLYIIGYWVFCCFIITLPWVWRTTSSCRTKASS